MKVKISEVKVEPKPMTEDQMETARTHINNAVALADSALETTKAIVIIDYRNRLNAVQGVGDVIKGVLKFIPGPPNPMVTKLGELEEKIKKIGQNMSDHFAEMKAFISEVKFSVKIMSPTLVLIKCMRDCLKCPGPDAIQNFREQYQKNSPLMLAYTCMSYLEQKSTNPLRMAMDAERVKTKAQFKRWESILEQMLKQFLYLEAFAGGLLGLKSEFNLDVLVNRAKEIGALIVDWKKECEKDETYWSEVKEYLEKYIPSHTHLNNQQKAKEIAAKLETYLTSDAFHVVVFNESTWQHDYTYHCPNEKTQIVGVWNKGKCCAFIYRSRKGNQMSMSDYENVRDQINNLREKKIELSFFNPMLTMIQKQMLDPKLVRGDGLICLIDDNRIPFIEVANCPQFVKGPDSNDKVVVQSDIGFGDVLLPIDGKASEVKVTEVKTEEKFMTLEQIDQAKTHINNTVAMADALLETRKALLEDDEAKNKLNAIQGVGDIIKGVLKLVPGAPNPMIEKLQLLETKVEKIGEKMSDHFAEIKAFITEVKFFVKIASPTSVLINCMRDCLKHPGPEAVQNFRMVYKKHSPLRLAYNLMSYLDRKATNPMRMAMDAEKVKTLTKFRKWEDMFRRILENFLFLEAFATGILEIKSQYNLDVLLSRTKEVLDSIEDWREEYKVDENYWDEVKGWFEKYITSHTHLTNQQKAKEIAAKLETYLTDDAFHVVVFNESKWQRDYTYYCPKESSQMIGVWNKGQCCAFIYRSRKANFMEDDEFQNVKNQVLNLREKKIVFNGDFEGLIQKQLVDTKLVRDDGLICFLDDYRIPFIEIANCPGYWKGSGFWELVYFDVTVTTVEDDLRKKVMLVSLP
uniref:Cytoplasmic dynein 2 heavy chain 1 n=1 Tax=Caenorhabditis tropicalis TaxID=1561998 RepID=A0A1I7ULH5_9PELO